MREKIIAGNWKMNKTLDTAVQLTDKIVQGLRAPLKSNIVLGIPFPFLSTIGKQLKVQEGVSMAAQNIYPNDKGAFTGEVSGPMLTSCNVKYVIVGHSERREYFHEENEFVAQKIQYAISSGLRPILCIGESLEVRDEDTHEEYVLSQLKECISKIDENEISKMVIAYEPIWAIGTGRTASPAQAQDMHSSIRKYLKEKFDNTGEHIPILYGGSMKPHNAESLLDCKDIDGGLIGGASLKAESFLEIIEISENLN